MTIAAVCDGVSAEPRPFAAPTAAPGQSDFLSAGTMLSWAIESSVERSRPSTESGASKRYARSSVATASSTSCSPRSLICTVCEPHCSLPSPLNVLT
ncbi:Uncharacterised protein [Mycobacteroides abscessus subsp. abscessus]|nr:Uncharacterised protein [Mycobacteroides abscessus subsp. abscessus]